MASGGLHVDKALREYLTNALAFRYGEEELKYFIRDGMRNFEQYGKRTFKSSEQGISVKVGEWKLNNYPLNITNGEMSIPGYRRFLCLYGCAADESRPSAMTYRHSFRSVSTRWWTV